jgi:hypothetical protein
MTPNYLTQAYEKLKKKLGKQLEQEVVFERALANAHQLLKGGFPTYIYILTFHKDLTESIALL